MSIPKRFYNVLRGYVNREWERIQGSEMDAAEAELQSSLDQPRPTNAPSSRKEALDDPSRARRILGVSERATFGTVRRAYEKLSRRCEPTNFPEGTADAARAAEIRRKVEWAYRVLSDGVDLTEQRFRSLEID